MNSHTKVMRPPTVAELAARATYPHLEDVASAVFADLKPSTRMTVSEAAEKYTRINNGPGTTKPWSSATTPYLVEPMNVLTSLDFTGMVFVGPARTGKTMMGLGWLSHTVKTDPADMLYVHMNRDNARKWSAGDLDRFLRESTAIRSQQITTGAYDNTFDKTFKSGMRFLLTYPTSSNLSGITVGRVMLIDYDRMADNIDGEGNAFDLASMRTTTFGRFAMTVAEASPNPDKTLGNPRWIAETPHEAPPISGILSLYNRGDRRRLYWCCPHCDDWFEPSFSLLDWRGETDPMVAKDKTVMVCPHAGCIIEPHMRDELNANWRWVREGETVESGKDGKVVPIEGKTPLRSSIASFWMKGPAAAFQSWGTLVERELRALKTLEDTGDDGPLRKTRTTDQGEYYIPPALLSDLAPEVLKNKAEDWGSTQENPLVPHGVRFLVATIDVGSRAFYVQVTGFTASGDVVVVDTYKIELSFRLNDRGERRPGAPFAFGEDWETIVPEVMEKTYELGDGSGRRMSIRATGCDSGGGDGTTGHAYNFWRSLRSRGLHRRFGLIKGVTNSVSRPEVQTTLPDSSKKDRTAVARGDVPVMMLNSNKIKDRISLFMQRRADDNASEGGMLRYPDWIENWFYVQLTNEIRQSNGKWLNTRKRRNEAFDQTCYALAMVIRPLEVGISPLVHFGYDRMQFDGSEPSWAKDWDDNDFVSGDGVPQKTTKARTSIADLAKALG